ncbi:related to GPI1 - required for N-acetylglucosaminyl phosphatidylinositol synthesis [Melanopsichium pennsylvanicum]|uniref:Related to GPI1 - required for N-acetylglucosaminyl phosphatidylinositol synthesis n=2 Tax=Melanopsichium pennsylvanicum TaxID=63383 RepID=A0AAJ5C2G4_9BASI|nr:related to GPI1-required for N-acetylglucosaminyl phosphatidylinositol synthesis [Melanopsichium pennsylvanicum 4]SNX81523.1 related to GPI1 - required for N-acetylglucosaminyl phosphatidylinositol synthesis [Melanopsichium pennsylvanicum]
MPPFDVLTPNQESNVLEKRDARRQVRELPAFVASGIDTLLVFWPDKLVDLTPLVKPHAKDATRHEQSCSTLLVGSVMHGHAHEAAIVVIGTIQAASSDVDFNTITSETLFVVGTLSAGDHTATSILDAAASGKSALPDSRVWLRMLASFSSDELPRIISVRFTSETVLGHPEANTPAPCAINLISYRVPNSRMLQYFALESLRLAPVSGMKLISTASALLVPDAQLPASWNSRLANPAPTLQNKFMQLLLLDPVHWRSQRRVRPHQGQMPRGTALRRSVELINRLQAQQHKWLARSSSSSANNATNGFTASKANATKADQRRSLMRTFGHALIFVAFVVQRALRQPLYSAKEHAVLIGGVARSPSAKRCHTLSLSLVSISACAKQLDVRISQLTIAPRLASRLRYLRKQQKLPTDEIAAPYIGLWNAIWLIANDLVLGHAASVVLLQNKTQLAHAGRKLVQRYLLDAVLWLLSWLENWPAGLKLNTELSLFFSDAYSSLTIAWHAHGMVHVLPRMDMIVVAMALVGKWMGVTMVLCMLQDVVSMCTMHISVFYTISLRTLCAFVYVLSALFDVFRGKKRNALRGGRLDDASYELDQLLLGTLLFTLVAFLFPTVYVYYLAFGLIRLVVVGFEVGLVETLLGLLNHLPLFALMLRFKDEHRLPAGVWLEEVGARTGCVKVTNGSGRVAVLQTGRFRLRSRPLAFGDIFEGYGDHVGGLVQVPKMIMRCILGRPLKQHVASSL